MTNNDEKGIAVIGLNRPKAMNAFSRSLVDRLSATVDHLNHDKDVRVVILRSLVPGAFCSGADLKGISMPDFTFLYLSTTTRFRTCQINSTGSDTIRESSTIPPDQHRTIANACSSCC